MFLWLWHWLYAGKQIPYSEIQSMIDDKSIVVRWDSFQLSPYFDYQGQDGKDYQVSLGSKHKKCIQIMGLIGLHQVSSDDLYLPLHADR